MTLAVILCYSSLLILVWQSSPHFYFPSDSVPLFLSALCFSLPVFSSLPSWFLTAFPSYPTPLHPPFPFVPFFLGHLVLASSSLSLPRALLPMDGESSIREERNCIFAPFATGTLQYLIKSAFVWRELWKCVWVSDKERCLTMCVDTVFACRREAEESVYICVCGDSLGMKGFLQSYGNWFTISLSALAFLFFSRLLSPSSPLLYFPSPYNPFFFLCIIM